MVFMLDVHRSGAEHKNTPARVRFCVWHELGAKERRRTRKPPIMDSFRARQWQDKGPNTKTQQQGCIFVFGVHRGGKKGVERENAPIVGGLHAQHTDRRIVGGGRQ
jgi:hypothetical protein